MSSKSLIVLFCLLIALISYFWYYLWTTRKADACEAWRGRVMFLREKAVDSGKGELVGAYLLAVDGWIINSVSGSIIFDSECAKIRHHKKKNKLQYLDFCLNSDGSPLIILYPRISIQHKEITAGHILNESSFLITAF